MKKFVLFVLLLAVLLAVSAAETQDLKFKPVSLLSDGSTPTTIHFFCSQDYDNAGCVKDAIALRKALAPYPTRLLSDWSYYLVMADDWKPLVRSENGNNANTTSPAFSLLLGRATVMDRSLFSGAADRVAELVKWSGLPIDQLVDVAVTHEMGHAICQDKNEGHAEDYGRQLRKAKVLDCSETPDWKPSGDSNSVAAASPAVTPR